MNNPKVWFIFAIIATALTMAVFVAAFQGLMKLEISRYLGIVAPIVAIGAAARYYKLKKLLSGSSE